MKHRENAFPEPLTRDGNILGRYSEMLRRIWTTQEILAVLKRYSAEGPSQLAAELNRSEDSISSQALRCGLRKERTSYKRRSSMRFMVESEQKIAPEVEFGNAGGMRT